MADDGSRIAWVQSQRRSNAKGRRCDRDFLSNLVMFFIILATALTLHRAGVREVETSRQVSEALVPLAGRFASLLYTIGLVGTGALAIPTLSGSAAYAFAEVFGWRQGIGEVYGRAPAFYAAFLISIAIGIGFDFSSVNGVAALYWSAVINGLLAPFCWSASSSRHPTRS